MKRTLSAIALAFGLASATAPALQAHEVAKGPNGGVIVDAGKYHAELVANGTTAVTLYLSDAADKPISSAGFKGTAILVLDGKSQRFALEPASGSQMVGTAPVPVKGRTKGVVQLTAPDGTTAQAKY